MRTDLGPFGQSLTSNGSAPVNGRAASTPLRAPKSQRYSPATSHKFQKARHERAFCVIKWCEGSQSDIVAPGWKGSSRTRVPLIR